MTLVSNDTRRTNRKILDAVLISITAAGLLVVGVGIFAGIVDTRAKQEERRRSVERDNRRIAIANATPVTPPSRVALREKVEKAKPLVAEIRDLDALISQMQTLDVPTGEVFAYRAYLMDKLRATLSPPVLEQEAAP